VQTAAVVAATLLIGLWHWANDGLWMQGDAPRHAATGVFLWDLVTALPTNPLDFALRYFARYPVLVAGAYPPLFHVVEALAFAVTGPSAYVAKSIVLVCAGVLGLYVMQWGRRWVSPLAGWAGACTVLLPLCVQVSNSVLLNMPATALGVGALYHCQSWLDTGARVDRARFLALAIAAVCTYIPGAIVLPVALVWLAFSHRLADMRLVWVPAAGVALAVAVMAVLLPDHFARQGPSLTRFLDPTNWRYYGAILPRSVGGGWLVLAAAGIGVGLAAPEHRLVARRIAVAVAVVAACLAVLPGQDERYALLLGPLTVLAAFIAVSHAVARVRPRLALAGPLAIAAVLAIAVPTALATPLKRVHGFDTAAAFLRDHGPTDSVLYSGVYDGVFGFYVRALDPGFERRVVLSNRFLTDLWQAADFTWHERLRVHTPAEAADLIRGTSGCRWVAIEFGGDWVTAGDQLLREVVQGPEFELVRTFSVEASPVTRLEIYRYRGELAPAQPRDMSFPSYSRFVFPTVEPVPSRRR
jgi:hypothetical protein